MRSAGGSAATRARAAARRLNVSASFFDTRAIVAAVKDGDATAAQIQIHDHIAGYYRESSLAAPGHGLHSEPKRLGAEPGPGTTEREHENG